MLTSDTCLGKIILPKRRLSMLSAMTSLSSKGQIVLPKEIRQSLDLQAGARFFIICEGDNIMLKLVKEPDPQEFWAMLAKEREWAESVRMNQADITEAIKSVRASHK